MCSCRISAFSIPSEKEENRLIYFFVRSRATGIDSFSLMMMTATASEKTCLLFFSFRWWKSFFDEYDRDFRSRKLLPMRTSLKCIVFYLIGGVIVLNLYFLAQLYFQHQTSLEDEQHQQSHLFFKNESPHRPRRVQLNPVTSKNEFIVLDWTGHQHIFREQDPIKCKRRTERIRRSDRSHS